MNAMNFGALLPVWLLGAPLLLGILERMRTPRAPSHREGTVYAPGDRARA